MNYRLLSTTLSLLGAAIAVPAQAKCELGQIAMLPVTMAGARPMIPAKINGVETHFLVDSGAFYSLISPSSAAQFGLRLSPAPPGYYLKGIGGDQQVSIATVKALTLADQTIPSVAFMVGGSETSGAGLLGQNILGIADVEYDLEHGAVRLMRARGCFDANLAYWAGTRPVSIVPIEERSPRQSHTIGTVLLNGAKIRAVFDTGAATSILSLSAAARAGIKPDSAGVRPAGQTRGIGRRMVQTWIAPFASFKIGGEEIRNTHLRIGDIALGDGDMLIGADFFLSHRIYVANGQRKLFFTYDGGPVFNLTPSHVLAADGTPEAMPADAAAEPTDAAGFSRRGAAAASRRDLAHAIADFSQAIALAPTDGRYVYQRALAYRANRQPDLAFADLDTAVTVAPTDVDVRMARARMRIARRDRVGALADLDAAAAAAPVPADERLAIGEMYTSLDAFGPSIEAYDVWIKRHPDDSRRADALAGRCWARGLANTDLDKAASDCDSARKGRPNDPGILEARALVRFRQGNLPRAIADADESLKANPRLAWSLYIRGLAARRQGSAQADADIAAALAISPHLDERAKRVGVTG